MSALSKTLVVLSIFLASAVDAQEQRASPIALDPAAGLLPGPLFQAWMSPHQEGGEEEDTPSFIPQVFQSTAPSVPRDQRPSRGHGVIEFTRDLSRATVFVAIEGVDPTSITMFHLHCGRPGQLGPILVDFALEGDLPTMLADGQAQFEITNDDLTAVHDHGSGLVGAFTAGCPITLAVPTDKIVTIAGMHAVAAEGELYFNLHTAGQTFFGDIRGQVLPVP